MKTGINKINYFIKDKSIPFNNSPHSPHSIILSLIKPNTTLLDIGCNSGLLGQSLKLKNITCDGIDINPKLLQQAKKYYRHLYLKDLYQPKLNLSKNTKYDYIVLSDILEHLPRPDLVLIDLKKYLNKNGEIIISLPNIARFEVRYDLIFGKFNYTTGGILSSDHLRFFTYDSATKLFNQLGLTLIKYIPTGLGHYIPLFPKLLAFQFVYILKISDHEKT